MPRASFLSKRPAAAVVVPAALLVALLAAVLTGVLAPVDEAVVSVVHDAADPRWTPLVHAVTDLASTQAMLMVGCIGIVLLAALRDWRSAAAFGLALLVTQAVVALVKLAVERARPPSGEAIIHAAGYSFPSGHSATSVACYGALALLVGRSCGTSSRRALALLGLALVVSVGASRVYLGAHYPTDVVAGWVTGGLVLAGAVYLISRVPARQASPRAA